MRATYSSQLATRYPLSEYDVKIVVFGPVYTTQRTCEADPAGENSSFIFTVCVRSVPLYHVKLACVVLHVAVKEFFESHF